MSPLERQPAQSGWQDPATEIAGVYTYVVLTETGPVLILTSCPGMEDGSLTRALARRGWSKLIVYRVPLERVRRAYDLPFGAMARTGRDQPWLRVLDYDGARVFQRLSLADLHHPQRYEA